MNELCSDCIACELVGYPTVKIKMAPRRLFDMKRSNFHNDWHVRPSQSLTVDWTNCHGENWSNSEPTPPYWSLIHRFSCKRLFGEARYGRRMHRRRLGLMAQCVRLEWLISLALYLGEWPWAVVAKHYQTKIIDITEITRPNHLEVSMHLLYKVNHHCSLL